MSLYDRLARASIAINNRTGGPEGWSLCARFYWQHLLGSWAYSPVVLFCDLVFFVLFRERNHCRTSYRYYVDR